MQIDEPTIQKVTAALNVAISLASIHAPEIRRQIMDAANALDDAVNASDD